MANSHKSSISQALSFGMQYFYISALATLGLLLYTYWDIIKIRYFSGFFGSTEISANYQDLFVVGFTNSFSDTFSSFLPLLITVLLASTVAYTVYNSYKNTLYDVRINYTYMNVCKHNPLHIALHYAVLYSAVFVAPLLFWCFYMISWFPLLAKFPLRFIFTTDTPLLIGIILLVFISMVVLTHIGLVLTRTMIRLAKST